MVSSYFGIEAIQGKEVTTKGLQGCYSRAAHFPVTLTPHWLLVLCSAEPTD